MRRRIPFLTKSESGVSPRANGIFLLDKPVGISSFQALRPLKRAFPKTKIGHAGTLDPAASGLLLIGIGAATRLLEYMEGMTKIYSFAACFGMSSPSYDKESPMVLSEGLAAARARSLVQSDVENALSAFRGPILQTPPAYSAIKVEGQRAYQLARAGETVTLAARNVIVHSLRLTGFTPSGPGNDGTVGAVATFEMTCSKGTYVRSLVHDLGQSLGCGAVTDQIRRLAIGPFRVEKALALDALNTLPLSTPATLFPLESAVQHLPKAQLNEAGLIAFHFGRAVGAEGFALVPEIKDGDESISESSKASEFCALNLSGRLIAIATLNQQGLLCPKKVLIRN